MPNTFKPLYLVGINEVGTQVLIMLRYRVTNKPVLQLFDRSFFNVGTRQSCTDVIVTEHTPEKIKGSFCFNENNSPRFEYVVSTNKLKFYFNDLRMSCEVIPGTAEPFINIITKL